MDGFFHLSRESGFPVDLLLRFYKFREMFDNFSGMFEVHTGNEWKKVAVKAGAGLAAIVCGRSFEKRTYCAEIVCFMYEKEKEGMD